MEISSKENTQFFSNNTILPVDRSSFKSESSASKEKQSCCGGIKIFLGALSFVYFAKALSGSYLKSTITQIERRFDIPSSLVGVIDGSFEIGNLLIIVLVSYFGAKLHRPRIIGAGCLIMSAGTFLIAMPQFFMGRYQYERFPSTNNSTVSISPCLQDKSQTPLSALEKSQAKINAGCEKEAGSSMWIYVLLGNLLRGIGETPIQPLGITYIDDYAIEENAALYIGCVQTVAIIGPIFGFLLGSLCAKLYVDIGFVDLDSVTITHKDVQWVGAWWLGYLIAGVISVLAGIPFWFLPKHLPKPESRKDSSTSSEQSKFITEDNKDQHKSYQQQVKIAEMAKDFLPSLKNLFGNPVYILYLCASIIQFNSLIGMVTYKPKYIEQQYGQTSSKTNFIIGLINIPAVAFGIFSGGLIMKKFRISVLGAAKLSLGSSFFGYLLLLSLFAMGCENSDVAGLTVSYHGTKQMTDYEQALFSECNSGCACSKNDWDPICGENGVTYISACLAGCQASNGSGKNTVFFNCSCVGTLQSPSRSSSAVVGPCQKGNECPKMFLYFLVISVITSYTLSVGGTPGYILLLRCIKPHLKSFALGIYTLAIRVLAGIPAPVYFGVAIDTTCLKWGSKRCGGRGACRLYDSSAFRYVYLGLTLVLGTVSIFFSVAVLWVLRKRSSPQDETLSANGERGTCGTKSRKDNFVNSDRLIQTTYWPEKETRL
ncbi:solute carrier organic anion transporter family member 1C1-like isoform X2 [Harpia harpyja]|uniref:solute carrier organic anion transporter family member 1C1-like isoform X2 n=1 Tax=Harpia harpyja TaxID=202280 RepID=UPI0022B0F717|nr:solute carrier organic anion transporter family member 1C1-like isoform X2 [Harpia harpyja]XP_052646776.1 solute carrier organic anion transporter family member 1C1-like isoform X2 [Harpia harpyja]